MIKQSVLLLIHSCNIMDNTSVAEPHFLVDSYNNVHLYISYPLIDMMLYNVENNLSPITLLTLKTTKDFILCTTFEQSNLIKSINCKYCHFISFHKFLREVTFATCSLY